jgi:hypothetical protein
VAARVTACKRLDMTVLRRVGYVLALARRRLVHRLAPSALVALGVAAGAAALAAVSAGALIAEARYVDRQVARIPEAERPIRAQWFGVPRNLGWEKLDGEARAALAMVGRGDASATVRYRQTQVGGALVDLAAADGLSRWVKLRSGRLPQRCSPARCEVVQLGGIGAIPNIRGLRLVRVGEATLRSAAPFGELVSRETDTSVVGAALRYHTSDSPPFLLAEGVEGAARLRPLATTFRSYGWIVPISADSVRPWEVDRLTSALTRARSELESSSDLFDVTAPTAELEAAKSRASAGARRLLVVGGTAAALLLAFAILAASALRRDAEAEQRRLTWSGARRWQLLALPAAEAGVLTALATALGWIVGGGAAAVAAEGNGLTVGDVLARTTFSTRGALTAAGLAIAAWLLVLGFVRARPIRLGGATLTPLDVAALGALAVLAVVTARGSLDAGELAGDGGGAMLLLAVPGLAAFVVAVVCARSAGPLFRLAARVTGRGGISLRLALLALARRPARATTAAAFLAVSFGLALFAESYRSTLARGQQDQASYATPADFVLREDVANLVPVREAVSSSAFLGLGTPAEILRRSGDVARLEGSGVALLGLPPAALRRLEGWRDDFAAFSREELARRIAPGAAASLRGTPLPPAAPALAVTAFATGDDLTVAANVETPRGEFVTVALGQTRSGRTVSLRGAISQEARGGRLVGFTFGIARIAFHDRGEGEAVREPPATTNLTLGALRAGRAPLDFDYGEWVAGGGVHVVSGDRNGARMTLILTKEFPGRLRPAQPTDGHPIPAIVSPRLAAAAGRGGILPLRLTGDRLRVRVVAIAERFPTEDGEFVVTDRDLVSTALNSDRPGAAFVNEIWLDVPEERLSAALARLAAPPYDILDVRSRAEELAELRGDPLARATLVTLVGAAAVALGLALLGLVLVAVTAARDDRAELFDLEAQGVAPATLRRQLAVRTSAIAALGLLSGLVLGVVLAAIVADFVAVTAGATEAEPPLVLDLDWPVLGVAAVAYLAAAAALCDLAVRGAFRGDEAGRPWEAAA